MPRSWMVSCAMLLTSTTGCGRVNFGPRGEAPLDSRLDGTDATDATDATDGPPPDSAKAAVLATAFAYWPFDDGAGTTAADATGHGNTLSLVNGPTWTTGAFGGAVSADGVNDYLVTVAPLALATTSAITLSLWTKRTYTVGPNHTLVELSTDYNSSSTGFGLFPDDDDVGSCAPVGLYVGLQGNAGYTMNCYAQPTSAVWHHVVVIYDKSRAGTAEVDLYLDGVEQTPTSTPYVSNNTNSFGLQPLFLFARNGTIEHNAGQLDDVALFARALPPAEVAALN